MGQAGISDNVRSFCSDYGLDLPVLMAPMAGASPVGLSVAVANAGAMGGCGALLMSPDGIADWAAGFRKQSNGAFQMNLWVPDPDPLRDPAHEAALAGFLAGWGPGPDLPGDGSFVQDFDAQFEAVLAAGVPVFSTIMGLLSQQQAAALKSRGIRWFATVTTLAEARAAEAAGADALIVQGAEAGGHRGAFDAEGAEARAIGGLALIPAVADATTVPLIAAGGIADGRAMAAALVLGASAVMIGTALLRTPEAGLVPGWADTLDRLPPENTVLTRAFSGRAGRAVASPYVIAAQTGPAPAPYPVQRALTQPMRDAAAAEGNTEAMQMWAGQAAGRARAVSADQVVRDIWAGAREVLPDLA